MSLSLSFNAAAAVASNTLNNTYASCSQSAQRMATGRIVNSYVDDAAGFAVAQTIRGNILATHAAMNNTAQAHSFIDTANGGISALTGLLNTIQQLSVSSNNGTMDATTLAFYQTTSDAIVDQIESIATYTAFNGINLFNGVASVDVQIGVDAANLISMSTVDFTTSALGIDSLDLVGDASSAFTAAQAALAIVNNAGATYGAQSQQLTGNSSVLTTTAQSLTAAAANITDADLTAVSTEFTNDSILLQSSAAMLVQCNDMNEVILMLVK